MAAVTDADLKAPVGELSPSFFPGQPAGEFDTMVTAIRTSAEERVNSAGIPFSTGTSRRRAVLAAAYSEGYRRAISYHSTRPSSTSLPDQQIQRTHSAEQLKQLREQMDYWEKEFQNFIPSQSDATVRTSNTVAIPNRFVY